MANSGQNYFASLSIVWVWVDMTAYTLAWRHPDKLMAVETSATSQAFALCRHPVRPVLLKIAPQPILNPPTHLWDFIQIGVASNPTCSRSHRSDSWAAVAVCTSEWCTEHRWHAERAEPLWPCQLTIEQHQWQESEKTSQCDHWWSLLKKTSYDGRKSSKAPVTQNFVTGTVWPSYKIHFLLKCKVSNEYYMRIKGFSSVNTWILTVTAYASVISIHCLPVYVPTNT